jgi:hypothetical protein
MYVDWIERAFKGGLRLMVAHMGSNEMFNRIFGDRPGYDDKAVVRMLVREMKAFVARHSGWMEIALSPADARDSAASSPSCSAWRSTRSGAVAARRRARRTT